MTLATQLTATPVEGTVADPRGTITAIHDEPVKGFFRRASLNGAGVVLQRGETKVIVPLAELWTLAEALEPALRPPAPIGNPQSAIGNS